MPRFKDKDAKYLCLATFTCGHVSKKNKLLGKEETAHTPNNCKNCKKGVITAPINAWTGFCNIEECVYETKPEMIELVIQAIQNHIEEEHKPKKGRPKKA